MEGEFQQWKMLFGPTLVRKPYSAGDQFRNAVKGRRLSIMRYGTLLHTSTVAPIYPLLVDTSLAPHNSLDWEGSHLWKFRPMHIVIADLIWLFGFEGDSKKE